MAWALRGALAALAAAVALWAMSMPPSGPAYPADAQGLTSMMALGFGTYWRDKAAVEALQEDLLKREQPLRGKLAVVTGATKGLGRSIAAYLHALGADLVLPCRSVPPGLEKTVAADADALYRSRGLNVPSEEDRATVTGVTMDLGDLDSIDAAVQEMQQKIKDRPIEILVNNAGLFLKDDVRTKQGFELVFGVNFLGTAHFTSLLLDNDMLRPGPSADPPRIISVSSAEHRAWKMLNATGLPFGYPFSSGISDCFQRYAYSKLAITTWMLALANERPDLRVVDLCPGPVGTDIASKNGPMGKLVGPILQAIFPRPTHSALFIVRLITEPEFREVSGRHYHMTSDTNARSDALDKTAQTRILQDTKRLLAARAPPLE